MTTNHKLTALALTALLAGCQTISADTAHRIAQWHEIKEMQHRDIIAKENLIETLNRHQP
ncbi:hypothetical protein [Neisseria dentiae]|uniref:hypothetical protein n=1 Tax=Neisseria dentiae TaxID=194197 RepID=UPI00211C85AF|nr:hypothetical protein [Neisseria dentiae]MCQ9325543.1 hypothetical protein [Neisseria dentiae]